MRMIGRQVRTKSEKAKFLNYDDGVNGYRIWDRMACKAFLSRHVTFDESVMLSAKQTHADDEARPNDPEPEMVHSMSHSAPNPGRHLLLIFQRAKLRSKLKPRLRPKRRIGYKIDFRQMRCEGPRGPRWHPRDLVPEITQ